MSLNVALVLTGDNTGAKRAVQDTGRELRQLEADAGRVGPTLDTITPAADRAAGAVKRAGLETANLAAQFNDIGVQLASGTSPFVVALQQGTQINQVLGNRGVRGTIAALGGAFTSLLNPVSLATIAIIGLGGAAVQWLTGLSSGADRADRSLEAHRERIGDILKGYDSARRSVDDYLQSLERLPAAAAALELAAEYEAARKEVEEFTQWVKDLAPILADFPSETDQGLAKLLTDLADGRISAEDFVVEMTKLGNVGLGDTINVTADMVDQLQKGAQAAATLTSRFVAMSHAAAALGEHGGLQARLDAGAEARDRLIDLTPDLRTPQQRISDTFGEALGSGLYSTPAAKAELEALRDAALEAQAAQERLAESRRAASRDESARQGFARALDAAREETAAIEAQTRAVGLSVGETERARTAFELLTQAKRAGIPLDDELRATIAAIADAQGDAAGAYDEATKAVERQAEAFDAVRNAGEDAIDRLVGSFVDGGATIGDVLADIGRDLAKTFLELGVANPLKNALFGSGAPTFADAGGLLGGLFGGALGGGATGGAWGKGLWGSAIFNAAGGAYSGAGISAFSSQIVNRPTLFPFANGVGLMGEAGPEAVLPLKRGADGALGVSASTQGPAPQINIHNYTGQPVETRQSRRPDGSVVTDLIIGTTQKAMGEDRFRANGIRGPVKSR